MMAQEHNPKLPSALYLAWCVEWDVENATKEQLLETLATHDFETVIIKKTRDGPDG